MKWFEDYVERAKPFHRASITAPLLHRTLKYTRENAGFCRQVDSLSRT